MESYNDGMDGMDGMDELEDVALLGDETASDGDDDLEYDEDGTLALARSFLEMVRPQATTRARVPSITLPTRRCSAKTLNGSWYVQFVPQGPHLLRQIRGPMRIEVASPRLRISGDIYVRKLLPPVLQPVAVLDPITPNPLIIKRNWYPQLPFNEYSWYFRSTGVTYIAGFLTFKFVRHLWNPLTQEFVSTDNGFMRLECRGKQVFHPSLPQSTIEMSGTAEIGGVTYNVTATKTSPFYRGCHVEVDVMTNRTWPASAATCAGAALSFASIYRTAGFDCKAVVSQTNLADDPQLTTAELQAALSGNREPAMGNAWRLWLLVGSAQGGLFGIMFDDVPPFREGAAGFFDPRFGNDTFILASARGKKLGEVPSAFLRTLVHEAGHAFNLFHPKHDVHNVPIGTTIMNQTGDVMSFATEANPYPCNVTFAFDEHNRTSLIHSPDPQVAPGWKQFGWGHGSLSSGVPEPVDAAGLNVGELVADDLAIEIQVPDTVFRGEFISATFVITNVGRYSRSITTAINLV
ncbi:MAG: hypothetical protein M3347_08695, partial [Armatimonadota bacterium]|nr:hypothetical protein [Armatimonadota bacterium]